MKEIYLLSGLGADKRVFEFIDLSGFNINHVVWIEPLDGESIESYSKRHLGQIRTPRPILIGVSFGGLVAVEIGKLVETERVILISSARTKFGLPIYSRVIGALRLNKLVPTQLLKVVNRATFWLFGTKTKQENDLLRVIIKETDSKFLKWAVNQLLTWKNTTTLTNSVHIHGTADKLIPLSTADFKIQDGGHLMIMNRGDELSKLIRTALI